MAFRAAWRAEVVRRQTAATQGDSITEAPAPTPPLPQRPGGGRWADLMRRAFGFDVLACPGCGGRLRLIALIDESTVSRRILQHLGLPTEVPAARPARAPPLRDSDS
jgi:hypothetical protein